MKNLKTLYKSTFFVFLIVIGLSVLVNGCRKAKQSEYTVKAAYVPAGYYLPFLVVEHDGLLEKKGYSMNLQSFGDNAEMISLFINGHLDVTAQSCFTMFPIENKHPGLFKFVYGQYTNSYYFMVPTSSKYQSLRDLKGTTIGTWKSPTAENYIKLILANHGLKLNKDYSIQRFNATDLSPALENQVVPVIFGFDVPLAKLQLTGNFRYLEEDAVKNLLPQNRVFNGGGFISTKLIAENPEKAAVIRDALHEAIRIIRSDPSHVVEIVAKKLKSTEQSARNTRFDEFTWPNDELLVVASRTLQLLREEKIVGEDIDVQSMFWRGH